MRKKVSGIIIGMLFILAGVIYVGDILNLWDFRVFFDGWWTLFIIIPCFINMINESFKLSNLIGLGIGTLLLLHEQGFKTWKFIFPSVLVLIGLYIIYNSIFQKDKKENFVDAKFEKSGNQKSNKYFAIFSGNEPSFTNIKVSDLTAVAIMGGVELNLKNAIIDEDITIDCTCILGGIDIMMPSNVRVELSGLPVLGGIENKFISNASADAPVVHIKSLCVLAGIDIM